MDIDVYVCSMIIWEYLGTGVDLLVLYYYITVKNIEDVYS